MGSALYADGPERFGVINIAVVDVGGVVVDVLVSLNEHAVGSSPAAAVWGLGDGATSSVDPVLSEEGPPPNTCWPIKVFSNGGSVAGMVMVCCCVALFAMEECLDLLFTYCNLLCRVYYWALLLSSRAYSQPEIHTTVC